MARFSFRFRLRQNPAANGHDCVCSDHKGPSIARRGGHRLASGETQGQETRGLLGQRGFIYVRRINPVWRDPDLT